MYFGSTTARLCRKLFLFINLAGLLAAAAGCGGGNRKVLYALGLGSPEVVLFQISGQGGLTVPGTTAGTGAAPDAIAFDPLRRFAYVSDSANGVGNGGVSQYRLNAESGGLTVATVTGVFGTSAPSTPAPTGFNPVALVVEGKGNFLFVANKGSDSISVFTIDPNEGTLTEVRQPQPPQQPCASTSLTCPFPLDAGSAPSSLATTGNSLFVVNSGTGTLAVLSFDTTGKLSAGSSLVTGGTPTAMDMDSSGKFLFVTDTANNTVAPFSIGASGQLSTVGSSVPTGAYPISVHVDPTGKFLYVADRDSNDVSAFSISSSGALAAVSGGTFPAGNGPAAVMIDSSGKFLFVANSGSNDISSFSIDSSGKLTEVSGSPFAAIVTQPVALGTLN